MTLDLCVTSVTQGLILALLTYAMMLPFRLLNCPDLTAEGAYPLGGALCAMLVLGGVDPGLAILLAAFGGGLAGIATSIIYLTLRVNTLLAGIIVSTMLYSVNLRLLGKPNAALFEVASVFMQGQREQNILLLFSVLLTTVAPLLLFLNTDAGLRLRAVGSNLAFACRQGISVPFYTVLGLFLAGCFAGLGGGLAVQLQNYMDVNMGVGIVVHALAALMIGEQVVGTQTLRRQLLAPLVGALIYQQIQGVALVLGLAPSDLKFFTGALVLLVLSLNQRESGVRRL